MAFGTTLVPSSCPYCGEAVQLVVDEGAPEQEYIEDCQVCCRPMLVRVVLDYEGDVTLELRSENE